MDGVHSAGVQVLVLSAGVSVVDILECGNEKTFWESAAPVDGS